MWWQLWPEPPLQVADHPCNWAPALRPVGGSVGGHRTSWCTLLRRGPSEEEGELGGVFQWGFEGGVFQWGFEGPGSPQQVGRHLREVWVSLKTWSWTFRPRNDCAQEVLAGAWDGLWPQQTESSPRLRRRERVALIVGSRVPGGPPSGNSGAGGSFSPRGSQCLGLACGAPVTWTCALGLSAHRFLPSGGLPTFGLLGFSGPSAVCPCVAYARVRPQALQ